jgi:hypothetical protein
MIERFVDHSTLGASGTPQVVAIAVALADGHAKIFKNRQPAKKLVDLESTREAAPRAVSLARRGDILTIK